MKPYYGKRRITMNRSSIRLFREDEVVIAEGEANKEMYKIVSGKAAVYFGTVK